MSSAGSTDQAILWSTSQNSIFLGPQHYCRPENVIHVDHLFRLIVREYWTCNFWSKSTKSSTTRAKDPRLIHLSTFFIKTGYQKKKVNLWSSWSQELCIRVCDQEPYISFEWNFDNHTKLASGTRQSADLIKLRLIFCFHKHCFDCTITAKPKTYRGQATPAKSAIPWP